MASQETAQSTAESPEAALDLYRRMLLIRRFEELVQSLFLRGEVYGTTHLCSGQEAVSVGVASALADGDRVACTYRGHGHLLARGLAPEALLGELLGRTTGVNGGRAGSIDHENMPVRHALVIGLAQCFSLWPGVSRSGTTITAALYLGLARSPAARRRPGG